MIKRNICLFLFLLTAVAARAQEGIQFNQAVDWKGALEQANKEQKLIFLDGYTSWCAPCKWMDKNVFTAVSVADFFNEHFINVKIDMEKGEGIALSKKYDVGSFPTFLFINDKAEVVHRAAAKMSVEEFLEEGKKAVTPTKNLSYLSKKYEDGGRDLSFLLDYYLVLSKSDGMKADKIAKDIISSISAEQLNTELGWKVIKALAKTENDQLGLHFIANQQVYHHWSTQEERDQVIDRLMTNSLYGLMKVTNEQAFMDKLAHFKKSDNIDRKKQGVMLEANYYMATGRAADYVKLTNAALKNEFKYDAEKLSLQARWALGFRGIEQDLALMQKQAYLMAKRAAKIEPGEYSIQYTFANVCLVMKKKAEALKAAKKARVLAEAEVSKIQKIAQDLLEKVEAL